MVSLLPWTTLTAGAAVSQWADTTRMARGGAVNPAGSHDWKKRRAGMVSSMESLGEPCERKKVSIGSSCPWALGYGCGSKIVNFVLPSIPRPSLVAI